MVPWVAGCMISHEKYFAGDTGGSTRNLNHAEGDGSSVNLRVLRWLAGTKSYASTTNMPLR
jgi:hypothetical protein